MRTTRPALLACGLAAAASGACIFTNPINSAPNVTINAPTPITRGQPARFSATVTDDQSEPVAVEWARTDGACPQDWPQPATWPANRQPAETFTVDAPMTLAPFCVWAVARDRYGAANAGIYAATPVNQAPVAKLDVVSPTQAPPYPFLSQFRLSAAGSTDAEGDALTFEWKLGPLPGSQAQLGPCADAPTNDRVRCLSSDVPGAYQIDLKVSDATDSGRTSRTLTVLEDKLPCIALTSPDLAAGTIVHPLDGGDDMAIAEDVFKVLQVNDDLDPWPGPGSNIQFMWSVARNDDPLTSQGPNGGSMFHLPTNAFRIGDKARVRVEIADRNNGPEIQNALLACHDDACAVSTDRAFGGGAGCLIRFTWTVKYQ